MLTKFFKIIFKHSRRLHKVIGLIVVLYLIMMSVTGILLNHPSVIRSISLPLSCMPSNYRYRNWNRGLINDAVLSIDGNRILLAGKEGIWLAHNEPNGVRYEALDAGYPTAAYNKNTSSVIDIPDVEGRRWLVAAARSDVFILSPYSRRWQSMAFPRKAGKIRKLLHNDNTVYAVAEKGIYTCRDPFVSGTWKPVQLDLPVKLETVALFRFLFKLHDGSLFGLVGKLLFDLAALAIIYLCVSGIKMWLFPKRAKRASRWRVARMKKGYTTANRRHLSIGLYMAPMLLVFALTGLFMRPPLLIAIARKTIPAKFMYPVSKVPSHPAIESALIDAPHNRLLVLTRRGLFEGPLDANQPFTAINIRLPIHGMGANVFQRLDEDEILVGSFSGLFRCNTKTGRVRTHPGNAPRPRGMHGRPSADVMAMSLERRSGLFYVGYRKGLIVVDSIPEDSWLRKLKMPELMNHRTGISLWHCLFEIHNGRYFRAFLGLWSMLIVPLGALTFAVVIITGCYDWLYRKKLSKNRSAAIFNKAET
jgi:hypothetical protein